MRRFEKGVAGPLLPDRGNRSMARIDDCVVRQEQQLLVDGAQNLLQRAAGEIGSADAPGEKRVSGKQLTALGVRPALLLGRQGKGGASPPVPAAVHDILLA